MTEDTNISKESSMEVSKYLKDSKEFLRNVKDHVDKNLDSALQQENNKIIQEDYFPEDKVMRELYNETLACYYSNLHNASLSVAMELLEYMSKKLYSEIFSVKYPNKDWSIVLKELEESFDNGREKVILECVDEIRAKFRNAQNHGNLVQLVEKNGHYLHKEIDLLTGDTRWIELKYDPGVHKENSFLEAKDEIQNLGTNISIGIINSFILQFFILRSTTTSSV